MSLFRSGITVAFFTFISRIFGFIRDIFITSALGTGTLADAFNVAFRLPNFFRRIFAEGGFSSAFVPIFTGKIASEGIEKAKIFAAKVLTLLLISLIVFIIFLELILPTLIYILAPGFAINQDQSRFNLSLELSFITTPYLLFISLVSLFGGILNSVGKFSAFAFSPILLNISIILTLWLGADFMPTSAHALAWGVLIAGIVQLIFIIIAAKSANLLVKPIYPSLDNDIRKLFKNIIPAIISGGVVQINIIIDQIIASFIPGAISTLSYADRIHQLPLALIGISMGTILLPSLSKQLKQLDKTRALATQNRALEISLLLSIPCCLALIILAKPIIMILFERNAFTPIDTLNTSHALIAFAIGLPAAIAIKIFAPCFFAHYDTKTPLKISLICILTNIICSLLLIYPLKHVGIALSGSISCFLNASLLGIILYKRKNFQPDLQLKQNIIKIIFSAGFMSCILIILTYLSKNFLLNSSEILRVITLFIIITIGCITYLAFAWFFKILELKLIKEYLVRK
ncbi:multidrug transporter MurJ [Rickettsiales bacterium Ac37b]|nr:multidrug transporter MurJ [Rickettsiales bacterium Ac37b]